MDSKITKFIIVCDNLIATKNMAHTLCDLLRKNGKRPEGYIKLGCCNINANGISIFVYRYTIFISLQTAVLCYIMYKDFSA